MPLIGDVNLLGVLLTAVAMFFVGFIFYGLLFSKIWQGARGLTDEQLKSQSPAWMGGGFVIEIVRALAIAWLVQAFGGESMSAAVKVGLTAGILFGVSSAAYEYVYSAFHSLPGFLVDAGHRIATFVVGAAVYSFFV